MATFKAEKLELSQINGGQEYEQGDFLQSDTINDVVEGTAYAQNVAEGANTKSDAAVSTANSANKTANAASAKVDTFEEDIATAQKTADRAVSNAATAQRTADNATTEINKIKNGTTVVPNANHANNADNAAMATKAQQDVNGNPINTTYATREFVTEQQGTRVKVNNANVAELSFTSDPQTQLNSKANQNGSYKTLSAGALIVDDTRSVNSPPSYYADQETCYEFKSRDTIGLADYMPNSSYVTLTTKKGWVDSNYVVYQEAVSADNNPNAIIDSVKCYRYGIGETWGEWQVVAKTSQVVRVDAAQRLTDEAKSIAQRNMLSFRESSMGATNTAGWYQVAALLDNTPTEITIQGSYYNVLPNDIKIFAIRSYGDTMMIAAFSDGSSIYQKVRMRYPNSGDIAYIDVYMRANTDNPTNIYVTPYRRVNDTKVRAYATDMTYIGTEDKPSDTTTVIVDIINGINTTGTIYQQGEPVFATDPSKLEPSTANGWTQTTTTGTLPSAGTYYVFPSATSGVGIIGTAIIVFDGANNAFGATGGLDVVNVFYAHSNEPDKWVVAYAGGEKITTDYILYKRIN